MVDFEKMIGKKVIFVVKVSESDLIAAKPWFNVTQVINNERTIDHFEKSSLFDGV